VRALPSLVAVGLPVALFLAVAGWNAHAGKALLRGDCPYYYATSLSLLADGDLSLDGQISNSSVHSGQISVDRRGRPVPKHPPLLALAALPFVAAGGETGALVFNLLQLALLVLVLHRLARRFAAPWAAAAAVALTAVASFLPAYAWNFSPDVFTALLLAAALLALPAEPAGEDADGAGGHRWHVLGRPVARHGAAGLLFGLACVAKLSFLLLAPAVLLLARRRRRALLVLAAGAALPLALYALLNLHLFGSPTTTSYDRIVHRSEDGVSLHSHRQDFNQPVGRGLAAQLLDRQRGLLWTAPLALVALAALPLLGRRHPAAALAVAWIAVALLLFYARYDWWWTSEYGNRFLLPAVVLSALPLAALAERVAPGATSP
jgi:4-amino-4-deoxy-L-arabinose transferase-like glycosyltransferase